MSLKRSNALGLKKSLVAKDAEISTERAEKQETLSALDAQKDLLQKSQDDFKMRLNAMRSQYEEKLKGASAQTVNVKEKESLEKIKAELKETANILETVK